MYTWFNDKLQFALSQRAVQSRKHFPQIFRNCMLISECEGKMNLNVTHCSYIHACFIMHALASL